MQNSDNLQNSSDNSENEEFSTLHNFDINNSQDNLKSSNTSQKRQYTHKKVTNLLSEEPKEPLFLSVSEAANIGGVQSKTIRRAIQSKDLLYKVVKNRYQIDFRSLIKFLHTKTKLRNKLNESGVGQYVDKWKK